MSSPQTESIEIVINGARRDAPADVSVEGLLRYLGVDPSRVAIERNREIVRKPEWNRTTICSGDELEIVQFVGGG
jgi:thiamine biosynthesis protein ThiS